MQFFSKIVYVFTYWYFTSIWTNSEQFKYWNMYFMVLGAIYGVNFTKHMHLQWNRNVITLDKITVYKEILAPALLPFYILFFCPQDLQKSKLKTAWPKT